MKADILSIDGKKLKSVTLPIQFSEEIRPDIIKKVVLALQSNARQPYGSMPIAGMQYSSKLSRRRRNYKGAYNKGISRVPRKTILRRGTQFVWIGATSPNTVGGRRAHPPKSIKSWNKDINKKENRKAIRSAISATINKELVKERGHLFNEVPLVIDSSLEKLERTKEVLKALNSLGLENELTRCSKRTIRPGKGKLRGRKYNTKKGPLIVVSGKCSIMKAASNILGVDIAIVNELNAELLAPGTKPGRLTLWTDRSIEKLDKEKLFLNVKKEKKTKEDKK